MIDMLIAIIGIIITIFFVIGTHEAAHFFAARWLGIKVLRFSIGFGKTLWQHTDKSGTEFALALIPLGGYVKMLDDREGPVPPEQRAQSYNHQPFYKKLMVVAAGPLMNLFCAFVLYWLIFSIGFMALKPVIGPITPNSIAAHAGMPPRQEIVSVDNMPVDTWTSVIFRLVAHAGNKDSVILKTKDHPKGLRVNTYALDLTAWQFDPLTPDLLGSLGLTPYMAGNPQELVKTIQYSPLLAAKRAWRQVADLSYFNLLLFGKILTGKLSLQSLGGPITIFQTAGNAMNAGILLFLSFLAFLSISIGIINLFPIPGLDGGHILLEGIEAIRGKPLPEKTVELIYKLGIIFILFLIAQSFINDILRLM